MYELIQVGERTFYIQCPAKMGVYLAGEHDAILIDSGNDRDAGRKVLKLFNARGWKLTTLINTHSHADHIGGNAFLQEQTGCKILVPRFEDALIRYPLLEPSFLYGGCPTKELRNKFLMAMPSVPTGFVEDGLPAGLEALPLPGHSFAMVGVKTADEVIFLADALMGEAILQKYSLNFIYDVGAYLETLERVQKMTAKYFVPAHADATQDIHALVSVNRAKVNEIICKLFELCKEPINFEELLKQMFDAYSLTMDDNQYVLVGSTLRSYLAYLQGLGKLESSIHENRWLWQAVPA